MKKELTRIDISKVYGVWGWEAWRKDDPSWPRTCARPWLPLFGITEDTGDNA